MRANPSTQDPLRRDRRGGRSATPQDPILAELFSVERLEQHARTLAAAQKVSDNTHRGRPVHPRVAENGQILLESYRLLARAIKDERSITPAAEWLVDNYPIVDEQLREIRDDLPRNYYHELPKLTDGHLAGYPRVLGLAWAYLAHTDSRVDPESLRRMVLAYQEVEPLTIGELWAIAISLRILLVENLRRLSEQIVLSRTARQSADVIADRLLGLGQGSPEASATSLRRILPDKLPTAASVQLFQRLRDQDPAVTPALALLEKRLVAEGTTAEETVRLEHQRQATMNVTVRNVITSMRLISSLDWAQFVEGVGVVDEILRAGSSFARLDFDTRDSYRKAIEELARGLDLDRGRRCSQGGRDGQRGTARCRRGSASRSSVSGSRLLLDLRRPRHARARARRAGAIVDSAPAGVRPVPGDGIPRDICDPHGPRPCRAARALAEPGRRLRRDRHHHIARGHPRLRPRGCPRQLDGHQGARPETAPAIGPRRRDSI